MFPKLKALYGFEMTREFPYGARYKSEKLGGLQVDVWTSGKWGIVGRNVYGRSEFYLAPYLEKEAKHVSSERPQAVAKSGKHFFIGLLKKPVGKGFLCVVELIDADRSLATQEMRVRDCRHLWSQKSYLWEVSAI